jgi:hypothetical protein
MPTSSILNLNDNIAVALRQFDSGKAGIAKLSDEPYVCGH